MNHSTSHHQTSETRQDDPTLLGIHHVTAIASDPQRNLDFYSRVLGLRLVKKTVNFDDPQTYHLYYGDRLGNPGSILTFFPWPGARQGLHGSGQTSATTFAVPRGTLGDWAERLSRVGVDVDGGSRFGDEVLRFSDPDGLRLELADSVDPTVAELGEPWDEGEVTVSMAIRGIDRVTLSESDVARSGEFLQQAMGFRTTAEDGGRTRLEVGPGGATARLDLLAEPGRGWGRIAAGSVHHVAFRVADDAAQASWQQRLADAGVRVTPVQDRNYFRSIYFREPGGVLFEIATDAPGFAVDEPVESLGSELKLPAQLEPSRAALERSLPALETVISEAGVPAGGVS